MVKLTIADNVKEEARIVLTKSEAIDICNGLNQLYGQAEDAATKFGTEQDRQEAARLKECRDGMQKVKNALM